MVKTRRFAVLSIAAMFVVSGFGTEAQAAPDCPPPTYPPVTPPSGCKPPKNRCAKVRFRVKDGGTLKVKGARFCAAVGDTSVDVFIRPFGGGPETFLGSAPVLRNGRYKFHTLVSSFTPGFYEVVVRTDGIEYVALVEIQPASFVARITNKTPANYAALSLWALVLVGMGLTLVYAPRRGWRLLPSVGRLKSSDKTRALPPPDVPFLDTRGFVPKRSPEPPEGDAAPEDWI